MNKRIKCMLHIAIAVILGVVVANITPPEGLTVKSMKFMGVFLGVIWLVMTDAVLDFAASIMGLMLCAFTGAISFAESTAFLSNSTVVLIMSALGLGAALIKTRLLNRIALYMMKLFPKSYTGQLLAILVTGLIIGPFIPALVSKTALGGPLAAAIGEAFGFPKRSKGMNGLFAMSYVSFCILGLIFLSGTAYALLILGMLNPEEVRALTWGKYFTYSLAWGVVTATLSFIFIKAAYKPEQVAAASDFIIKKIEAMGPVTRHEKIAGLILVLCITAWIVAPRIQPASIAMSGLIGMFLFGVLDKQDLRSKLPWEMIAFIGSILGYAALLISTGWSKWLGQALGGVMGGIISNVYVYVIVLALAGYLLRCVVISQTASFSITFLIMAPIASNFGIHPFITGFVTSTACMVWNTRYQNTTWLAAFASAGGEDVVSYNEQFKMSIAYSIISIIACLISIPFWKMMGLC